MKNKIERNFQYRNEAGHGVFQIMSGTLHNTVGSEYYLINKRFVSNLLVMNQLKIVNGLLQDILTRLHYKTLWVEQIMLLKNLALVGHIDPGNYFITVKFGDKVEQFEIRSKPTPPRIITTANELRGNPNHKPEIRVTDIPNDTTAKIKLVMGGTDGDHDQK